MPRLLTAGATSGLRQIRMSAQRACRSVSTFTRRPSARECEVGDAAGRRPPRRRRHPRGPPDRPRCGTPRPSTIGTWTRCMWSTSPAARKSRTTGAPPPIRTSWPSAASRAVSSASAGAASRKWNVVPPSMSIEGPRAVSQHEGRCVERRVRAPPAFPVRVVPPAGRAELVGAHDLGADAVTVALSEGVVDSGGSARVPEAGTKHPLVQSLARMAEGCIGGLRFPGSETVEGDGQVVDPCE